MLINEITGSFWQGAVNRLAQRAGTAGIPQPGNAPGFAIDPQGQAARASAPLIDEMAKSLDVAWRTTVQNHMKNTPNSVTGKPGVVFADIRREHLERALALQLNKVLAKISNGRIQDYVKISSVVDPSAYNGQGRQAADLTLRELERALDSIVITEPSDANKTALSTLWKTVAKNLYTISSLAQFQGKANDRFGQTSTGQLTVDGDPVEDATGKPIMMGTPEAKAYMSLVNSGKMPAQGGNQSQGGNQGPASTGGPGIIVPTIVGGSPRPRTP
jgi:hypothetical protein